MDYNAGSLILFLFLVRFAIIPNRNRSLMLSSPRVNAFYHPCCHLNSHAPVQPVYIDKNAFYGGKSPSPDICPTVTAYSVWQHHPTSLNEVCAGNGGPSTHKARACVLLSLNACGPAMRYRRAPVARAKPVQTGRMMLPHAVCDPLCCPCLLTLSSGRIDKSGF